MAILATVGIASAVAQPRAIGGQLGNALEFSYEHTLGNNFVSVDAGFPGWFIEGVSFEAVSTYNWLNPFGVDFPTVSQGDWNWYMGVGAGIGDRIWNYSSWTTYDKEWKNWFYVGAAGRFGVEYNFWFPLQLSAEWRPIVGPCFYTDTRIVNTGGSKVVYSDTYPEFYTKGLYMSSFLIGVRYKF